MSLVLLLHSVGMDYVHHHVDKIPMSNDTNFYKQKFALNIFLLQVEPAVGKKDQNIFLGDLPKRMSSLGCKHVLNFKRLYPNYINTFYKIAQCIILLL